MNRLTRDEILHEALNAADLPGLDERDRRGGVIGEHALCVGWLQRGLDWFNHKWPWSTTVLSHSFNVVAGQEAYDLPDDFVIDYKDGIVITDGQGRRQMFRGGLNDLIKWRVSVPLAPTSDQSPVRYVVHPPVFRLYPTPSRAATGAFYYYSLPSVLSDGARVPVFPSDEVLVEYIRLKALEWARQVEPGTALAFSEKVIGDLQKAGQGKEVERTAIGLDQTVFHRPIEPEWGSWMGQTVVS